MSSNIKQQAIYNLIGRAFEIIFVVLLPIILVRLMPQSEFGEYRQIILIGGIIISIFHFNISNSLFYFLPLSKNEDEKKNLLYQTIIILCAIALIYLVLSYLIFNLKIPFLLKFINLPYVIPFSFYIVFSIISMPLNNLFVAEGNAKYAMVYYTLNQFLRLILIVGLYVFSSNLETIVWALVLHAGINTIFLFCYLVINYKISIGKWSNSLFQKQMKYIVPMGMSIFVGVIGKNIDQLLLSIFFTSKDFAIYSIGLFKIPMIAMVYTSVGNVVLTRISENSIDTDKKKDTINLWQKMVTLNAIMTIPILVFSFISAKDIFTILFGNEYLESVRVFQITIMVFIIQMLGYGYILRGYGKTDFVFKANFFKMVFSIILGYFLIKQFGYIGAAVTILISFSINGILQIWYSIKLLNISISTLLPIKNLITITCISLFASIIIFGGNYFINYLYLKVIINGIAYLSVVALLFYYYELISYNVIRNFRSYF